MTATLALVAFLTSSPQECDERDKSLCVTPIAQGEAATFDGQLLSTPLAVRLGQKADRCDALLAIEVEHVKRLAAVDLDLERRLRAIDKEAYEQSRKAIETALTVPWYERPPVTVAVTVILTSTVFSLAVYGAGHLR